MTHFSHQSDMNSICNFLTVGGLPRGSSGALPLGSQPAQDLSEQAEFRP
jgi:hypothetical protein